MTHDRGSILIVDDHSSSLYFLAAALNERGFVAHPAADGASAIDLAQHCHPDLALLDVCLPDMNGYQVCESIHADAALAHTPVIFMSAHDAVRDKVSAFDAGGVDFITKPFELVELVARVERQVELRRKQREVNFNLERMSLEVSRRRQLESEVRQLANLDELTRVFNRRRFFEAGLREFARAARNHERLSLSMMDIDHFKAFNDTYGHLIGDEVLRTVAERLRRSRRPGELLARYGGEEFIFMMPATGLSQGRERAETLRTEIASVAVATARGRLGVTMSFGVATIGDPQADNLWDLIDRADQALYQAKAAGRNRVHVWLDELSSAKFSPRGGGRERRVGAAKFRRQYEGVRASR